ncbi:hypothetical protein FKQ68_16770 [Escherichia coli]|nr:hypothetical protein [Escherichia coli]HCD2552884.1 hypothetical protein [Escherichia coli]HCJ6139829.1 hypothetical protein [Escherichia coli]HCN6104359.1 hypothetical protein [Escherichia coli]HCN7541677.1 hypothetical protein [Escherichia coli]
MNNSEGLKPFQQSLAGLPQWVSERILQQINQLTRYEPVIGIMGIAAYALRAVRRRWCPTCLSLPTAAGWPVFSLALTVVW